MPFSLEERYYLAKYFDEKIVLEDLENYMTPAVHQFLRSQNRLKTIVDSTLFTDKNHYRPFDSVRITKFLTPNISISKALQEISDAISGDFLVYVDFHFMFSIPDNEEEEGEMFKFQGGSKASHMNDIFKIKDDDDRRAFNDQFREMTAPDYLNAAFEHHCDLFDYRGSGLQPYCLCALLLHITKLD